MYEIDQLKAELAREKQRNDVVAITKRLERMQKERKQQDDTINTLNKAIENFKQKTLRYETQTAAQKDNIEGLTKKEEYGN